MGRSPEKTSGQSISTKGRIAHALVITTAAGEPFLKPRFRRDALPLRTSLQPRAAAGVFCLHSPMHFNGGTTRNMAPSLGGIRAAT